MAETRSKLINPQENLNKTATALLDYLLAVNPSELAECMESAFELYSNSWSLYKTRHQSIKDAIDKMKSYADSQRDVIIFLIEDIFKKGKWNSSSYNTYFLKECVKKLYQYDPVIELALEQIHSLRDRLDLLLFMHIEHPHLIEKLTHELDEVKKELEIEKKRYADMLQEQKANLPREKQEEIIEILKNTVEQREQALIQSKLHMPESGKILVLDKINEQDLLHASHIMSGKYDQEENEIENQKRASAEKERRRLEHLEKLKKERDDELLKLGSKKSVRQTKPGDVIALFSTRAKSDPNKSLKIRSTMKTEENAEEQYAAQEAIRKAEATHLQRIESLRTDRISELEAITEMSQSSVAKSSRMEQVRRLTALFANKQKEKNIYTTGCHVSVGESPVALLQESYMSSKSQPIPIAAVPKRVNLPSSSFLERQKHLGGLLAGSVLPATGTKPKENNKIEEESIVMAPSRSI